MRQKLSVNAVYLHFEKVIEPQTCRWNWKGWGDQGGVYLSEQLLDGFSTSGSRAKLPMQYWSHQNGVPERMNRTLLGFTRAMIQHKRLDTELWADAWLPATFVRYPVVKCAFPSSKTPYNLRKCHVSTFWRRSCLWIELLIRSTGHSSTKPAEQRQGSFFHWINRSTESVQVTG